MVRALLSMQEEIGSSHASDALALAICHAHRERMRKRLEEAEPKKPAGKKRAAR
jgi:Holliday junction resolvasome RuvABC endonuclease subunit